MMICIPLRPTTQAEAVSMMKEAEAVGDMTEVWLDQIEDLNITELVAARRKPLVLCNKAAEEKGRFSGTEEDRVAPLIEAAVQGVDYIDIGFHTSPELLEDLKNACQKTKLIISYHNFEETPPLNVLKVVADKMLAFDADIIKVATMANADEDNTTVLELMKEYHDKGKEVIGICMGEKGKRSRIYAPLYGGYLMYAPLSNKEKTAPGQIIATKLREHWAALQAGKGIGKD